MSKNVQHSTLNAQHRTGERFCLGRWALSVQRWAFLVVLQVTVPRLLLADTHYVDIASTNPVPPYTNWATAATVIQDTVDAAGDGDLVLVAAGMYGNGGRAVYGSMTNRVAIDRAIIVQSVNGATVTFISGETVPISTTGDAAIRCAYVGTDAVLDGFTLTNGATRSSGDVVREQSGGGVWCESGGSVLNSTLSGNSAYCYGGGVCYGTLYNCTLLGNVAYDGGGAYYGNLNNCVFSGNSAARYGGGASGGKLNNCTVSGNVADSGGGGTFGCTLHNSIIYYNTASVGPNWFSGGLLYCCTTPNPGSKGCIEDEPALASVTHLSISSLCIGKGSGAYTIGKDIDGEQWKSPPSMGCDEVYGGSVTGGLQLSIEADYTNVVKGMPVRLAARIEGAVSGSAWSFGDGTTLSNRPYASHEWGATGCFAVALTAWNDSNPTGVAVMVQVRVQEQQVCYVVMSNAVAAIPYNAWSNAAARIQDAVDVCEKVGGVVLVSNGVYDTGGRVVYGAMTNRVAILKPMTVRSVNGPDVTVICGLGPVGDGAVRCAYVPNSALLAGFTLINGATLWSGNEYREMSGGGVCCEPGGVVSNCIISGNVAALYGGGACGGTLENCTIARNSVSLDGGGTYGGTVNNCIVSGNSAGNNGGGSYDGTLHNCTVSGNSADEGGGGVCFGNLDNCIVYGNSAPEGSNWNGGAFHNCCTTPDAPGTNNVADRPQFLNPSVGNYRLMATSPCIDRGVNQSWMLGSTDLDGNPRIRNGTVDMGAYEFAFEADLRGLLQGPYDTNTHAMTTLLSTNVPLTSHYADNAVATEAIPSNAADWVVVEVRKTNAVAIASTSAFLDRNGNVMAKDGGMGIVVEASAGQYYVTLKHRNHLAARSAQPVAFTNTTVSYNFTTGTNQYYGGTNACVQLEPGVWGMIGGDADGDGKITDVDRQIVSQQMGRTGYLSGDLNLDGKVDGNDQ